VEPGAVGDLAKAVNYSANTIEQPGVNQLGVTPVLSTTMAPGALICTE
jgi:hypothetical protein